MPQAILAHDVSYFLDRCLRRLLRRRPRFEIYTDGSLKRGIGSWAFVALQNDRVVHEASGRMKQTDSNRMEFRAAIEALQWLPAASEVVLHSDSRILVDALTHERHVWKAAGWVRPRQREIHYLDEIKLLDGLSEKHDIAWKWVRAHSGLKHNERCDQLCIQVRTARFT
jgi:ribonuclease HI